MSVIPEVLAVHVDKLLGCAIQSAQWQSGGDINSAATFSSSKGEFFIKWNDAAKYPGMFEAEAKGLQLLKSPGVIRVPEVVEVGVAGSFSFLLLECIQEEAAQSNSMQNFGRALAKMHQTTTGQYGLDHPNYIGSLPQSNKRHDTWVSFFVHERLEAQVKQAVDRGFMGANTAHRFERLYQELDAIFPTELPALLHGDLWGGNYMIGPKGEAYIFDPAVYFGHREMDLAMTRLFGGYNQMFYDAYNELSPLAHGWEDRVSICNLYPLLVHLNLFGGSYLLSIEKIVSKF